MIGGPERHEIDVPSSSTSNSLEFPKPAGPCPETRLAGYKPKGVIQTFPFQCSHDAASPDGAASPRRRRLRAGQWELFIFFARPAHYQPALRYEQFPWFCPEAAPPPRGGAIGRSSIVATLEGENYSFRLICSQNAARRAWGIFIFTGTDFETGQLYRHR